MVNQQNQQQRGKKKEPYLHLDLSSYEKEPGRENYRVIAEIWLSRWSGNSPRVQIMIDGALWQGQDFYPLDQQRCLTANITGLMPGAHTIVVVTEDGRHRNMKPINIPEKKQPKPTTWKVVKEGSNGKYKFLIRVLDENNIGVEKAKIVILDSSQISSDPTQKPEELETDKNGSANYQISFAEKEKFLTLSVSGSPLSEKFNLFGPWPKTKIKRR
jgi:hypothetical protein